MNPVLHKLLIFFVNLIRITLMVFIFFIIVAFIAQNTDNAARYPTLVKVNSFVHHWSDPLTSEIKKAIPYRYQGIDYSLIILMILVAFCVHFATLAKDKLIRFKQRTSERESYEAWRSKAAGTLTKEKLSEIDTKFETLNTTNLKGSNRTKILKEFTMLKAQLDSMGQQLAFLAIDVVDSTGMKRDEDKYVAAYDFDRYNQLVNESLRASGVIKSSMTPDGIMCCFRTVDDAVKAAKSLLTRLQEFNRNEKKMKADFQIRCGINAGFVYMDEETPLEQISDRVIDIAGHMQKYAKPNCINIAASAIEPLKTRQGFEETPDVIDEQKVFQWSEK